MKAICSRNLGSAAVISASPPAKLNPTTATCPRPPTRLISRTAAPIVSTDVASMRYSVSSLTSGVYTATPAAATARANRWSLGSSTPSRWIP